MGIQERDWYQRDQRAKEYKAAGVKYKNSQGWYYRLNGYDFGPCDKDNICRLMREHRLDDSSLVKHGSGEWMQISKLRKEFPKGGYIYKTGKNITNASSKHSGICVSIWGIILAVLAIATSIFESASIEVLVVSVGLSILLPTIIKKEWRKRRSFTALGLISAIVLLFLIVYLGVHWYWIIDGIIK